MTKIRIIAMIVMIAMALVSCGDSRSNDKEDTKIVLTLGTATANSSLIKQVDIFNRQNPHISIEIKEYGNITIEGSNALNTMQMEIVSGEGPDIIDFGYQYSPVVVSKGITEDLYSYMEKDEDFCKENYFTNIIDTYSVDGKLYALSPDFSIKSVVGSKEKLGDMEQWNMKELMKCYQEKAEGGILFPGDSRKEVFSFLCMGSMGNFVNWEEGTCSFDCELFKELLTFSNEFPDRRIYEEDYSVLKQFLSGKALLYPVSITDVYGCTRVRLIFSDMPVTYIGYPMDEKNGNIAQPGRFVFGINKNSKNKDVAWEFIKSFLNEEYQNSIKDGIPLLKSEVVKRQEEAQRVEYEMNTSGEMMEKVKDSIIFEGEEPIKIMCIEKQDANNLLKIINCVETAYVVDADLYSIIIEEVTNYFENNSNLESVTNIIQNRASIYISEQHR